MMAITLLIAGCNKPPEVLGATPPSAAPTSNVADGDVTTNVKTALLQHSAFKGLDINVITLKGDVRLIGVVDNQGQIDTARKVAALSCPAASRICARVRRVCMRHPCFHNASESGVPVARHGGTRQWTTLAPPRDCRGFR